MIYVKQLKINDGLKNKILFEAVNFEEITIEDALEVQKTYGYASIDGISHFETFYDPILFRHRATWICKVPFILEESV